MLKPLLTAAVLACAACQPLSPTPAPQLVNSPSKKYLAAKYAILGVAPGVIYYQQTCMAAPTPFCQEATGVMASAYDDAARTIETTDAVLFAVGCGDEGCVNSPVVASVVSVAAVVLEEAHWKLAEKMEIQ